MALQRRTSIAERIAGGILGFSTGEETAESESVLAKYFPELTLKLPAKGGRGGRLGRGPQVAEQTTTFKTKEAVLPTAPTPTAPTEQPKLPDYSGQFEDLKKSLLSQSQEIASLRTQLQQQQIPAKPPETKETPKQEPEKQPAPTTPLTTEQQTKATVTGLYKEYFNREPDVEGLKYWTQTEPLAKEGITPSELTTIRRSFEASPEYQQKQKSSVVEQAYQQAFGRAADPEGLKYWTSQPTTGGTVEAVKQQLLSSAKAAAPTSEDRVRAAYKEVLGREPDEGGLKYWSQASNAAANYEQFKNQLRAAAGVK